MHLSINSVRFAAERPDVTIVPLNDGNTMSYNPLKRDSTWTMVLPGCYIDPGGFGHVFPDEFLAFLSVQHPEAGFDPNSKEDYDLIVNFLAEHFPEVPFCVVKHDRQEN